MKLGVFLPVGNNGWLISSTSPQYSPTWELNRDVTLLAERIGFDFALSMVKLRGFGGKTRYWEETLDSMTLMAALAVQTQRIQLLGTVPSLLIPPAVAARMAVTIDAVAPGRFGLNLVTGWLKEEYSQMGMWPGDEHFQHRYEYLGEYVTVLRDLMSTGRSDFKGRFFTMSDCRLGPLPAKPIPLVAAGSSAEGVRFAAENCEYNFCSANGVNEPQNIAEMVGRLKAAAEQTGSNVRALALVMVIAGETDSAAMKKWEHYKSGVDMDAIHWRTNQAKADTKADINSTAGRAVLADRPIPTQGAVLVGSYETIAKYLDEISQMDGISGAMLIFDDFRAGLEDFGKFIQPLMKSRAHVPDAAEAAV